MFGPERLQRPNAEGPRHYTRAAPFPEDTSGIRALLSGPTVMAGQGSHPVLGLEPPPSGRGRSRFSTSL